MLKLKYIFLLLTIGFFVALFMPEKYHYAYLGKVVDIDTTFSQNNNVSVLHYTYVDKNHKTMQVEYYATSFPDYHSINYIKKNNNERAYEYIWWTNTMVIFSIYVILGLISLFCFLSQSECGKKQACNNCPIYFFCSSDYKVGGFSLKKFIGKND